MVSYRKRQKRRLERERKARERAEMEQRKLKYGADTKPSAESHHSANGQSAPKAQPTVEPTQVKPEKKTEALTDWTDLNSIVELVDLLKELAGSSERIDKEQLLQRLTEDFGSIPPPALLSKATTMSGLSLKVERSRSKIRISATEAAYRWRLSALMLLAIIDKIGLERPSLLVDVINGKDLDESWITQLQEWEESIGRKTL